MSEYKLVPLEPTQKMIEAAEDAHMPFGDMGLAIRMAVLAAPVVQVEAVAYAVFAGNGDIRIWSADPIQVETLRLEYGDQMQPLYTAPQPVEQRPAPEIALMEAFDAGQRAAQAEAAALVEALNVVKTVLESDDPAIAYTVWAPGVPGAPETLLGHVCAALDAYRKQGG